ncbi:MULTISPECIES: hypothetical protein [Parageobacillus]|jgi:hypothetical protein|uniref:Uncharacterized protein n=1 Tax=Parageobacillus thermoglucosidasius TaxID=1426 RepID=A0A1B7KRA5_PARTM|nr:MULTISPECIES: hypothetical protein [Parageobacillus]OAT72580.1 hypothetical protein A7K69_19600 [Parageobacillus thermoglucosidasius]BDG47472.1 hypothetical protein PspKH34_20330 [Parageobacillus sp. KH3-4]BDG47474.1 hypothetical protein PspKH34_20350 [Parageobacillus sp. KH3-4]
MENLKNNLSSENLGNLSSLDGIPSVDVNLNQSQVAHSGNSDVNVHINIQVDVKPIALAILYSLLAKNQLSNEEFELALRKLEKYKSK